MKKDGGNITYWQIHNIIVPEEDEDDFIKAFPELEGKKVQMFTGTVVDEPTGRWNPGDHMRSTYIVEFDRETGTVETLNTIYHLDMKTEGLDSFPDLGNKVLFIYY